MGVVCASTRGVAEEKVATTTKKKAGIEGSDEGVDWRATEYQNIRKCLFFSEQCYG